MTQGDGMSGPMPNPGEVLAQMFHERYERLAPEYGYKTRDESAVPWDEVPEPNRSLMIAVCTEIVDALFPTRYVTGLPQ